MLGCKCPSMHQSEVLKRPRLTRPLFFRGMVVKLRDKFRHPECYTCTDCDINLKQKGHFFVEDQIYCEKHARERVTPPEGYDVVTVFPK